MLQNKSFRKLKIVPLGHHSAPACLGLTERTFGKESPEYRTVLNFTRDKRAGFIASIRGFVVGFVIYDNRNREKAEILVLAVHRPDRRHGVGRALLGKVVKGPRGEVMVKVDDRLLDAHLFLRALGFRAVEIEHGKAVKYVFHKATEVANSSQQDAQESLQPCGGPVHEKTYRS